MKYCSNCGKEVVESDVFCPSCGHDLKSASSHNQTQNKKPNLYLETLKKYFVFSGRASRKEYWLFILINIVIGFILGFIEGLLGIAPDTEESVLTNIWTLITLIPSISVGVRRMHDVGKEGIYIIIPIYNLILALSQGTKGENKFGPDPRKT